MFKWQVKLLKAMGSPYVDAGQVRLVNVLPKVSVAQVIFSCGYMSVGISCSLIRTGRHTVQGF